MSDIRYQAYEGLTNCMLRKGSRRYLRATKLSVDTLYDFSLCVCPNVISVDFVY
jgi:hypothetical protein